ncbi:MAG TPA: protein-L-isoaspartate O-methyltransferase [Candidatus Paceibacterota bacterium]|nr:protein-L-isoaspartate O-methyltransferase [Candidatus Paceibacterota bacterium]
MNHKALVDALVATGVLRTSRIIDAFRAIDRKDFVPTELEAQAYLDSPLPIGQGQTISQPHTVAFMCELLQPQRGERVLDVGSGSGWTTALLAHIVGTHGAVIGTEIIPDLATFGARNLAKYGFKNACIHLSNQLGAPKDAPFDRILVSAAAEEVPQDLLDQLRDDGTLVMPVGSAIVRIHRGTNGKIATDTYDGFAFVPLRY